MTKLERATEVTLQAMGYGLSAHPSPVVVMCFALAGQKQTQVT